VLHILSRLVDTLPVGVIALDREGRAVIYNRVEQELAGRRPEDVLGRDFFRDVGVCMDVAHIAGQFRENIGRAPIDAEADFSFPFPLLATPREVRVRLLSFEANETTYGLLLVRDVAHERAVAKLRETLGQMLVHDIKSPLTAVMSNLEFLQSSVRDVRDAADAVAEALTAARRIEAMLVNVLDTSRLETDDFPLRLAPVDIGALLERATEQGHASARARNVSVRTVPPPAPVVAEVDGEVVLRICENLIDNAVRHGHTVTLAARAVDGNAQVEVADDGPGIEPADRGRIFEMYAQVEHDGEHLRGRNRGLGLTFVQLAARAHGGEATVRCPATGGSVFSVTLPLVSPVAHRAANREPGVV
jgi:photoactive yellow protein